MVLPAPPAREDHLLHEVRKRSRLDINKSPLQHLVAAKLDQRIDQRPFAVEVEVDTRPGQTGSGGHIVEGEPIGRKPLKDLFSTVEKQLALAISFSWRARIKTAARGRLPRRRTPDFRH